MREDRYNITKVLAVTALLIICNVYAASAQRHSLEFKGGAMATSTRNSGCESKTILDAKPGIVVGGSYSWNFFDGTLRGVAEGYYASQGEKYTMDGSDGDFNSDINYFKIAPNARYYAPYVPAYVGAGFYIGAAASRVVNEGDLLDQSHSWTFKKYYKGMDFGTRVAIGAEIGVSEVKFLIEAAYEFGFSNISNRKEREIKNQSLCVSLGLCFDIAGRHYRHF